MAIEIIEIRPAKAWNSTLSGPKKPMKRTQFKCKVNKTLKRVSRRPLAKSRNDTVGKLKKRLWAITRELAFIKYGSDCYTCPARALTGSNRHLGHFISSSVCSAELRYDLSNLRPQCYRCNIHLSGNWLSYEAHLTRDGIDVEALKQRNRDTAGMKADSIFYNNLILEREAELKALQ